MESTSPDAGGAKVVVGVEMFGIVAANTGVATQQLVEAMLHIDVLARDEDDAASEGARARECRYEVGLVEKEN
jgi:hypothetical protein